MFTFAFLPLQLNVLLILNRHRLFSAPALAVRGRSVSVADGAADAADASTTILMVAVRNAAGGSGGGARVR